MMGSHHWYVGALALFFSLAGTYMSLPFHQIQRDNVGCDVTCYGYMLSIKAASYVVVAIFMGHMSDKYGRHSMLYAGLVGSLVSFCIGLIGDTILLFMVAVVPASANQIPAGMKALFSDYCITYGVSDEDRTSFMGFLGMAIGLSYTIGPFFGSILFSTYKQAMVGSIAFNILSIALVYTLPPSYKKTPPAAYVSDANEPSLTAKVSLITSRVPPRSGADHQYTPPTHPTTLSHILPMTTPGARLLLAIRFLMGFAYSLFNTSFNVSLQDRFHFSPFDYGLYMSWVGLSYFISQGWLMKILVQYFEGNYKLLLLLCSVCLGMGRLVVMETHILFVLYGVMFIVIVSLGVMNTILTTSCTVIAGTGGTIGALFGAMEGVEKIAGLIGPAMGGWLHKRHHRLPAVAVCVIYMIIFFSILAYYNRYINDMCARGIDKKKDLQSVTKRRNTHVKIE